MKSNKTTVDCKWLPGRYVGLVCTVIGLLIVSCTTRSMRRIDQLSEVSSEQDFQQALKTIRESPKLYGELNRFLYWYDQGLLYHYLGEYDSSLYHLEQAELVLDNLYARSVTNEAASLLTNDNIRPYRSRRFEQVLLHQFLSFNYLAGREPDESLVETRKMQLVFDRFKSKDRRTEKYNDDGMAHFISALVYQAQGDRDDEAIALYKSVSAYRGNGMGIPVLIRDYAYHQLKEAGRTHDIDELSLSPVSRSVYADSGYAAQTEIILIGFAGRAPVLKESIFWGTFVHGGLLTGYYVEPDGDTLSTSIAAPPIPPSELAKARDGDKTGIGKTFHIKFALPAVVERESLTDHFKVYSDGSGDAKASSMISDIEYLLKKNIEDNRPTTLARTAVRVVLRTIAAQKAKSEMETGNPLLNFLLSFGTDILTDQMEKADTRLSLFLPRTIHITRIPVSPGTHTIRAAACQRNGTVIKRRHFDNIEVKKGEKRFLFYPALM
ncbi:MAG: hypothetical protein ACLFSB_16025 [Chitinispirillaceae bacterium]